MIALCPSPSDRPFHGLRSLWDMLQSYLPIYKIAIDLQKLRRTAEVYADEPKTLDDIDKHRISELFYAIHRECLTLGLIPPHEMALRLIERGTPKNYAILFADLNHLDGSIDTELKKEAVFRISPERKGYYEQDELFGPRVASAFPSCARDIQNAGNCYALGQADACVHHLMLVLERGLNALAVKLDVPYERTNWQNIIEQNASKLRLRGSEFDFHREANGQFGFLKDVYRNHSEHTRDDYYDVPKALSILNHVCEFMQALEKGGLSE
jgi:hypothetical protein